MRPTLIAALWSCIGAAAAEDRGEMFASQMPVIVPFTAGASAGVDREVPEPLSGQPGEFARTTTRAAVKVQPWRDEHDEVQLNASMAIVDLQSDAVFPKTGPLPERLDDDRVGALYRHVAADKSLWGVSASVGSASDHPFTDSSALVLAGSVFTRIPVRESDAWLLSLNYSNDRAVLNNVPLPGIIYQWTASPSTTVFAGFPLLAVIWKPSPRYGGELFLTGLGTGHLGASAHPLAAFQPLRLHAGIDYGGDVYRRADASDKSNRIIFRELRAAVGCGLEAGQRGGLDLYAGYASHRQIIEDRSFLRQDNRIDIASGAVFGVSANGRF
jgi:hypothetical protein